MIQRLRMVWFWIVAFRIIIWNTLKGNSWHLIQGDFHLGDSEDGSPIRKNLIAKRSCNGLEIYWQDLR